MQTTQKREDVDEGSIFRAGGSEPPTRLFMLIPRKKNQKSRLSAIHPPAHFNHLPTPCPAVIVPSGRWLAQSTSATKTLGGFQMLGILILATLLLHVFGRPYDEFIAHCAQKNYNGLCDLQCYNYTGDLNDFEKSDCAHVEATPYRNIEFVVSVYPPNATSYFLSWERQVREALGSRVELETTEEDVERIVDEYVTSPLDHLNKRKWKITLSFTVWLRVCEECPQGKEYIDSILEQVLKDGLDQAKGENEAQVHRNSESSGSWMTQAFYTIGGIGMLCLCTFGVVVGNRKRPATQNHELPHHNSKKMRWENQTRVWLPPFEDTDYETVDESKTRTTKKGGLRNLDRNVVNGSRSHPVYHLGSQKPAPLYSIPSKFPPPPTIPPPPIREGTLDKSACYQPVTLRTTHLHYLVSTKTPGKSDRETDEYRVKELTDYCMEKGPEFDINAQDLLDASTPLILAVKNDRPLCAAKLIELGADVHRRTTSNSTVLHHAVYNQDVAMLKLLLEHKAKFLEMLDGRPAIDALNCQEKTPLMLCASSVSQAVRMAKLLVEAGASMEGADDPEAPEKTERTALHHAAMENNVEFVRYLLELAEETGKNFINNMDYQYHTALWHACNMGNLVIVKLLLDNGADQFVPDQMKIDQPATIAQGNEELLRLLIEAKKGPTRINRGTVRKAKDRRNMKRRSSGYISGGEDESRGTPSSTRTDEESRSSSRSLDTVPLPEVPTHVVVSSLECGSLFESTTSSETAWIHAPLYRHFPRHSIV